MSDNISLADIKIKDIENSTPFTVYFGYNGNQYITRMDSIDFESEPMEVTLAINYHKQTRTLKNPIVKIDTKDEYLMVNAINIKMGLHNRHIDVELKDVLTEKDKHRKDIYGDAHVIL